MEQNNKYLLILSNDIYFRHFPIFLSFYQYILFYILFYFLLILSS